MHMIYPMLTLVALTFAVGFGVGISRLISIKRGHVTPEYYKLLSGDEPPEYTVKLANNYSNLLEVPVLFYILCVLSVVFQLTSALLFSLAWCFVALRMIHSVIHITYNHPPHRFYAFLTSCLVLLAMWLQLFFSIQSLI